MTTIFLAMILIVCVVMIISFSCDIRLDALDLNDMEKDIGYFSNHPSIPKQYIQYRGKFVATIFLN